MNNKKLIINSRDDLMLFGGKYLKRDAFAAEVMNISFACRMVLQDLALLYKESTKTDILMASLGLIQPLFKHREQ